MLIDQRTKTQLRVPVSSANDLTNSIHAKDFVRKIFMKKRNILNRKDFVLVA